MSYDPTGGQPSGGQGWQGGQPPQYPPPGGYGQQQPAWGAPPPAGGGYGGPPPSDTANPFAALLDFSFTKFATPGLIKLIYIVGTVLLVLFWLGATISAFSVNSAGAGLLFLIGGAIVVVFYLMFLRVSLEFFYAVVRMSEDIHKQNNR